jgi:hypothetical protein
MMDRGNLVKWPWSEQIVAVDLTWVEVCGKESEVLEELQLWKLELKRAIERAVFASYLDKIYMVDAQPETVPFISSPEKVWNFVEIQSVSPHYPDVDVIYVIPEWDFDLQHEWCIKGGRLVYVGQVLCYGADGYEHVVAGNYADGTESIIEKYSYVLERFV